MRVTYIDNMGTDLTVVNAARVSFDKTSELEDTKQNTIKEKDVKLIKYLARHNHWTPFGHCQSTFRIKAPIFVARQLAKHQIGMVWNEVSRRYVDSEPEFYVPYDWRKRASNVKQGSSDEVVNRLWGLDTLYKQQLTVYNRMLKVGVCPEQARMVLPQSMYTEWYWTGSLSAWARVCKLRLDEHTQKETQDVAKLLDKEMLSLYPISWKELMI
tara:strand:+ start:9716 stop:10354 length:639 start_codon:yes stop_codon:yes gene_type:complete